LDDPKNAKQAYEHSLSIDSENVYTNLNYAVFLYNQGDRQGAATRLINFRKIFDSIIQGKRKEIDPEVGFYHADKYKVNIFDFKLFFFLFKLQEISSKLGPILNVGDLVKPPSSSPKEQPAAITNAPSSSETSAQKYTSITKPTEESGDAYKREFTMASVSRVGFHGESSGAPSERGESRPATSDLVRRSFGADQLEK
jgi:hypothetical protein